MTKEEQLNKNRQKNPKRMSQIEKDCYTTFIDDKAKGKCQCGCGNDGVEYHHSEQSRVYDDRSIILICRKCHSLINNMEYKNIDKSTELIRIAKEQGKRNWRDYTL